MKKNFPCFSVLRSGMLAAVLLCVAGCRPDVDSEYQVVTPEPVGEKASEVVAAPAQPTPDVAIESDPQPAEPVAAVPPSEVPPGETKPDPVESATGAAALGTGTDLSINVSRPFAVPLPEMIPVSTEATVSDSVPVDPVQRIKLLIPDKEFLPEQGSLRVSFDDIDLLKVLNMEPVPVDATTYFPDWLSGLNGQTIRLRGWMYPPAKSEGISRFLFVRDSGLCCFGAKPRIYDKVAVRLKQGESTRHIVGRPFDVVGTLVIEPVVEDENELFLLYHIEEASIAE